MLRTTKI